MFEDLHMQETYLKLLQDASHNSVILCMQDKKVEMQFHMRRIGLKIQVCHNWKMKISAALNVKQEN